MAMIKINSAAISETFNAAKNSSVFSFLTGKASEAGKYINAGMAAGGMRGTIFQAAAWAGGSALVGAIASHIGKIFGFAKEHKVLTAGAAVVAAAAIPGVREIAAKRLATIAELGAANPGGAADKFRKVVQKSREVVGQVIEIQ